MKERFNLRHDSDMREKLKERYFRLSPDAEISVVDSASKLYSGIGSTETLGRDGHIVRTSGIQDKAWLDYGGPMPFCHDDSVPAVAAAVRTAIYGKSWRVWWRFVPREDNPLAGQIADLTDGGYMRALSLSWRPLEGEPMRGGGFDFSLVDCIECSIVQCPALVDALIDSRARGISTAPMRRWAESALDRPAYRGVARPELERIYRASRPRLQTRSELRRRAQEIQAKGERQEKARLIAERARKENW